MKLLSFWKPSVWLAVIFYLSLMPGEEIPHIRFFNIPNFDKLVHFGFYFILSIFLVRPLSGYVRRPYLISFVVAAIVSGLIEILQQEFTRSRHGDLLDFAANVTGIITALIVYNTLISGKKRERYF